MTKREARMAGCLGLLLGLTWNSSGMGQAHEQQAHDYALEDPATADRKPPPLSSYAGDEVCAKCHVEEAATYRKTAHHLTSQLPDGRSIAGNFNAGSNVLQTADPQLTYVMRAGDKGYTESAVMEVEPSKTVTLTQPIDIVVGAARKSQTYLYWKNDELFELPVSYWTQSSQWTYSPGYHDGSIDFDKPIVPRCLECHGSYFESNGPPLNRFRKTGMVLGIFCEKCHGPGREHAALYSSGTAPARDAAKAIVNPALLPRARQIDLCALCHAGAVLPLAPSLSFVPGDAIDKYLEIPDPGPNVQVDVHGNQLELLKRSRCYRSSEMTCSTCHNVHLEQRDAAAFSPRCLSCHKVESCGKFKTMGKQIANNCVDCHMPLQKSEVLFSELNGQELQPLVRNHQIAIYPESRGAGQAAPQNAGAGR